MLHRKGCILGTISESSILTSNFINQWVRSSTALCFYILRTDDQLAEVHNHTIFYCTCGLDESALYGLIWHINSLKHLGLPSVIKILYNDRRLSGFNQSINLYLPQ